MFAQQAAVLAMGSNGKSLREQFDWLFNTVAKEDTPTEVRLGRQPDGNYFFATKSQKLYLFALELVSLIMFGALITTTHVQTHPRLTPALSIALATCLQVPSVFTCPLTMETFRDPAITKYGQSYERAVLLEHLSKVRMCVLASQRQLAPLHLKSLVEHVADVLLLAFTEQMGSRDAAAAD